MKKSPAILMATLLATACGGGSTVESTGKVGTTPQEQQMNLDPDGDGTVQADVKGMDASMSFAFDTALPIISKDEVGPSQSFRSTDGSEDAAVLDLVSALDIVVSSPRSGVSVSLMSDGMLVASPPTAPGEWSITLDDARMNMTLEWYNETTSGLSLKEGQSYDVMYSLGDNCCVDAIEPTSMKFELMASP